MMTAALAADTTAAPARRPSRIGTRDTGDASSRSRNPFSMSRASSLPAAVAPNDTACTMHAGSTKSRNESTSGKPGMASTRPNCFV